MIQKLNRPLDSKSDSISVWGFGSMTVICLADVVVRLRVLIPCCFSLLSAITLEEEERFVAFGVAPTFSRP